MNDRLRAALGVLLRLVVTAACVALVGWNLDLRSLGQLLSTTAPLPVVAGVALFVSTGALIALRWLLLLRVDGVAAGYGLAVRITFESLFFGLVLPTAAGGDVYRAARIQGVQGGVARAAVTLLIDRLYGLWGLCLLGAGAALLAPALPAAVSRSVLAICVVIAGLTLAALHPLPASAGEKVLRAVGLVGLAARVRGLSAQARGYLRPRLAAAAIGLSVTQQVLAVVGLWLFAEAVGGGIGLGALLAVAPTAWLAGMVPSLGGLGPREGALSVLLQAVGATPQVAAAIVLLSVVATLARAAVGAVSVPLPHGSGYRHAQDRGAS